MAKFNKSGARKPLAEGSVSLSAVSGFSGLPEDWHYSIGVRGEPRRYSVDLSVKEALNFVD